MKGAALVNQGSDEPGKPGKTQETFFWPLIF